MPPSRRLRPDFGGAAAPLQQDPGYRLAAQYALVHYASGAVISYIPKNACTTLRVSLAIANGLVTDAGEWRWVARNTGLLVASLREVLTAPRTVVMLRCPYRRLASAFLDKIVDRRPPFWQLYRLQDHAFSLYDLTFRQFAAMMQTPRLRVADPHWRPQRDLLIYDRYDLCVALETFAAACEQISALTGLAIVDARGQTDHGTAGFEMLGDRCYADVPLHALSELKRQGRLPSHRALYDAALTETVGAAYAGDLALYRDCFGPDGLLFSS